MRKTVMPVLIATATAIVAASAIARERADRVPVAVPAGAPVSCIPLASIGESKVRDDRTIDFVMRGRRPAAYRVVLPQSCPELGFEQRFAYETSLSELCSTDIITVLHTSPVQRGASCGLAPFQPVTLPERRR